MPGNYNANALVNQLSDAVAADPDIQAQLWNKVLHLGAKQEDVFSAFEAREVPAGRQMRSPAGIFCTKSDLRVGGGQQVHFSVISDAAGPGVQGEEELTGNTSTPTFKTFNCIVDWHRDAVEFTKVHQHHIAAGGDLWPTTVMCLREKLGRWRQHHMMVSLKKNASGNIMYPNGKTSRDSLTSADTIDPMFAVNAKQRATRNGAQPIRKSVKQFGTDVRGYLFFATETALMDVRNDTGYQNAIQNAGQRSNSDNPSFSGELVKWQEVYWYEHKVIDPDWDDYKGSPLEPRGVLGVAFSSASPTASANLVTNASNTLHRYFQFFAGYDYKFYSTQAAAPDAATYYAWIVNPDASVGFVSYTGSGNVGNTITIDEILVGTGAAGVSTKGAQTVGNIDATGDLWDTTPGVGGVGAGNTSAAHTYTASFSVGALILEANANGAVIGYSYLFGANAAVRAYGVVELNGIEQDRDYGFVKGKGFETVFGQTPVIRTDGITKGYVLCVHHINPEGVDVPSL